MYVQIPLWERNLDVVLVECVIDDFLHSSRDSNLLFYKHPDANLEVHATLSKVAKGHSYRNVCVRKRLSVLSLLLADGLKDFHEELSNLLNISTIGNSNGDLDEFVAMVSRHIFEGLAKESAIQESNHGAVIRGNLSALIGDVFHFACNSVAFNIVANMDSARHKTHSIEEILQNALHGKAETCSQTCAHNTDSALGNLEKNEHYDNVKAPANNTYNVASQGLIDGFVACYILFLVVEVETSNGVIDVAEYEEKCRSHTNSVERNANQASQIDQIFLKDLLAKARHLENFSCPINTYEY